MHSTSTKVRLLTSLTAAVNDISKVTSVSIAYIIAFKQGPHAYAAFHTDDDHQCMRMRMNCYIVYNIFFMCIRIVLTCTSAELCGPA